MCLLAELGYVQGVCLTWMDCNLLNKQTEIQSQGSTPSWQGLRLALIRMLPLFPHKHVAQSLFASACCVSTRNFQVFLLYWWQLKHKMSTSAYLFWIRTVNVYWLSGFFSRCISLAYIGCCHLVGTVKAHRTLLTRDATIQPWTHPFSPPHPNFPLSHPSWIIDRWPFSSLRPRIRSLNPVSSGHLKAF